MNQNVKVPVRNKITSLPLHISNTDTLAKRPAFWRLVRRARRRTEFVFNYFQNCKCSVGSSRKLTSITVKSKPPTTSGIASTLEVWWVLVRCSRGIIAQVAGPVDRLFCLNSSTVLGLRDASMARAVLPSAAAVTLEPLLARANRKGAVNTKDP